MRKVFITALSVSAMILMAGCLKDKGFDNQEYGTQVKEVKGVAFPQASSSPITVGINSQATPQVVDGPYITLEQDRTPTSPVTVTLQIKQSLVTDAGLEPLALTDFTVSTLSVSLAAGQKLYDALKITVPNSSTLDPTKSYGIGLTISAVDQGYTVAANMKDIVIAFNIKNKFDGKYVLKGQFYHPTSAPTYPWYTTNQIQMITSGPNSVKLYSTIPGLVGFYHPWSTGTGITAFAGQEPEYTVNPSTNAVTVQNVAAGAATFYTMALGFNNAGYNSRYDPATKTIYACFGYNLGAGGTFQAASTREWIDTLIYTGPR